MAMSLAQGQFGLRAEGINLNSRQTELKSTELNVEAQKSRVIARELTFLGVLWRGSVGAINLAAQSLNSTIGALFQRIDRATRLVDKVEQIRAGRFTCMVKETLRLRGNRAEVIGDRKVKIDAQKILLYS